jgi:ABC-type transport system involved in multi-copper enzyme maturation permease subunit
MFFPPTILLFFVQGRTLSLSCVIWPSCYERAIPFLFNALLVEMMAIVLYGAIFFLFAVIFSRPLLPALLVTFIDVFFANTPFANLIGAFSPAYHIRSIAYQLQIVVRGTNVIHLVNPGFENPGSPFAIIYLTVICLILAIFFFRRKDLHTQV